jgi:hypothetical protein
MSESPLRQALEAAMAEHSLPMKDLTVLAPQNDPFRVDTDARHRDGEWLAITARELGLGSRKIHLRGLHYMVIGRPKPDNTPYANTESDWLWLSGDAGKAARWLGYIDFDQIVDQRNAPPVVRVFTAPVPEPYISVGLDVDIPDADDIEPYVSAEGYEGAQPYKLVLIGEKSSLEPVLAPIAEQYEADLYLPTGEPSDTMLHQMAKVGAEDGRDMVVLYFSDCDPSGWQMPISVGRKLQALKVLLFPGLDFQVHRVALTPDQVREYALPSTPLKDTEKRADAWQRDMGVAQTEIDALAALRPELLDRLARAAIAPYYDTTLKSRAYSAYFRWRNEAQGIVDGALDREQRALLVAAATEKLAELRAEIDAINDAARIDASTFDLPELEVPEAELPDEYPLPLLDSDWPFAEQCRRLIDSKAYRSTGAGAP